MTAQTATTNLVGKETLPVNWLQRLGLLILFLLCEVVIYILGSNYFDIFPTNKNPTFNLITCAVFLAASLWFKQTEQLNQYWRVAFAFFVASVAYPITGLTMEWLLDSFSIVPSATQGLALGKFVEVLMIVAPILVLTKLSGADMGSIFLKRGNLKLGLSIGGLVFFNFATSALLFFATRFTRMEVLGNAIVWGLVFSLANGFMEELWLRGILLRRFQPFIGVHGSVWLTAIVFAVMHGAAYYFMPAVLPIFVLNTLTLGLACGYLMMKSDSIWGAALIHAAADFFLFVAVLANA
jgi:membrane protease YdiL (CAAX protease family)